MSCAYYRFFESQIRKRFDLSFSTFLLLFLQVGRMVSGFYRHPRLAYVSAMNTSAAD